MQLCLTQLASGPAGIYPYIRMEIRRYLQPGERIQLLAHKHALCLVRALVPPILLVLLATLSSWGYDLYLGKGQLPLWLLAVVALVAIAWGAYVWLDWSGKALIVTNSRVLWVEHVPGFKEKHWQSPLRGLQNVSASSRWLQRLVRSGDLLLDTRSEGRPPGHVDHPPTPHSRAPGFAHPGPPRAPPSAPSMRVGRPCPRW